MNLSKYTKHLLKYEEIMSIEDYLDRARNDSSMYANAHERLLKAIGEPELYDTSGDLKYGRIFGNRLIKRYKQFEDFYGMETVIEQIVAYLIHGSQNLEEKKQILYMFGPPGSAKSSLAERLKSLMEKEAIYVLAIDKGKDGVEVSPINESPLGLLSTISSEEASEDFGIPKHYFNLIPSPWATKRLDELQDITKFSVIKVYPSQLRQIAIAKTEPGDENNQDISTLVGKLDIRKLEYHSADDPDAYRFNGGLCLANRGILDFVEMFKAPIKVLHPLLTATQEGNYKGTEALAAIPFEGIIIAHSNEAEWDSFRNNKNNEAFLDRICLIKVPYCLRFSEEKKIYRKLISNSALEHAPCLEHTLDILSKFSVLTRLEEPENCNTYAKLLVYNGEDVKEKYPKAKRFYEYKESASNHEGFFGFSTRSAFKILSQTYNYDPREIAADPVHLFYILKQYISNSDLGADQETDWTCFILDYLEKEYEKVVGTDIQMSCIESYDDFGQHLFDRYVTYADHWLEDQNFRNPDTGQILDRKELNDELESIEKKAGINNPKDFRQEVVKFCLRYRGENKGKNPKWTSYQKIREVLEANLFKAMDKLLGQISFEKAKNAEDDKKTIKFINKMKSLGYTEYQVRRNVEWYQCRSKAK